MSNYIVSVSHIPFGEFSQARDEVRELVSEKLFEFVKTPGDLQNHIDNLPAIQKDLTFQKVSETYDTFDEMCRVKGYGAAYLKGRETEVCIRNKIQISDINIRDLFIVTAMCNKITTIIMTEGIDEYDLCNLLVAIGEIVEKPSSLTVCDSSHPF